MFEATNKINKLILYNEAINHAIYGQYQRKTIKNKPQNLKSHQTQKYNKLSLREKAIRLKLVFKVKNYFKGLVARFKAKLVA